MISGWRFLNLGAGAETGSVFAAGPFPVASGGIATVTGDDAIRQAIVMLLSTRPGERVIRPDYGCPLNRLVFLGNDATTAGLAIHYVGQALRRFEPRIDVVRLAAGRSALDASGSVLEIRLDYRVRTTQRRETLTMSLDLMSEGG
ncbi:GPW/gp25 family protein [Aureimonas leprariae]|uniref:GPW/gp25 family protein n=1 Tax=Plantimonas leprariae TaxID=2615207 RepID=A0A7V7PRK0_9HYPH|nr:GPW/gp25 family protein [Aureimonas leprariae]KAB0681337.1 GPW/gp25 family protein [Aureimonas leprariae]